MSSSPLCVAAVHLHQRSHSLYAMLHAARTDTRSALRARTEREVLELEGLGEGPIDQRCVLDHGLPFMIAPLAPSRAAEAERPVPPSRRFARVVERQLRNKSTRAGVQRGEPSPGADVAWGEPSTLADVGRAEPVPVADEACSMCQLRNRNKT
jgi:hypothetical protein